MLLIVGLGNPGKEYEKTNHNVGFRVVDEVAKSLGEKFKTKECDSLCCSFFAGGERVVLAKPQTYMNNSGIAVKQLVRKYDCNSKDELVVIADDFDCQSGTIRIRTKSGNTTHNGIRSIKQELSTNEFVRIKVSIGSKPEFMSTADFVLSQTKSEATKQSEALAVCAIKELIEGKSVEDISQKYSK